MARNKPNRQRACAFSKKTKTKSQDISSNNNDSKENNGESNVLCMELIALLNKCLQSTQNDRSSSGYNLNSPAVTTHLTIVAEIINRLANNSNYCKTTAVAVATIFATFTKNPDWLSLVIWLIPIVAIALLDSLFVYLKKRLSGEQEEFVSQFLSIDDQNMAVAIKEKFRLKSIGKRKDIKMIPFVASSASKWEMFCGMLRNLSDISVMLFYGSMVITLVLVVRFRLSGMIETPDSINSIQIINEQTCF